MAKYKMSKSTGKKKVSGTGKRRKSRRVGGIGTGWMPVLEFGAGVVVGSVGGRMSAGLIGNLIPAQMANPTVTGFIQVAGGLLLAKEVKQPFVKGMGFGLAANGGTTVVVASGVINGLNDAPLVYRLNGVAPQRRVGNLKFVAGPTSRIGTNGGSNLSFVAGLIK